MYDIETKIVGRQGYFTPDESNAYYKTRYARDGITVHWWGQPGKVGTHDQTVNYLIDQASRGLKSVNYVVSNAKITMLVPPDYVAFASNTGNPTTVSIEFQPDLDNEGYKRGGWLIRELEGRYKKTLRLYKHSDWIATACPGTISLDALRKAANITTGGPKLVDANDLNHIYQYGPLGRTRGSGEGEDVYLGKTASFVIADHLKSKEYAIRRQQAQDEEERQLALIRDLRSQLDNRPSVAVDPQLIEDAHNYRKLRESLKI